MLGELEPNTQPEVLADFGGASDAGVYQVDETLALVQSVDFFTPIVDEAELFGGVAAANALSDLYAMGAEPMTALSIVGFPKKGMDRAVLGSMLRGGQRVLMEAGAALLGGHSVQDPEIKFGFAVTGCVHPKELITNAGARPDDLLYLTKPLGTGVLATALKRGELTNEETQALHESLLTLNRSAATAMRRVGVSAATDVTGFGLLGHAGEMARASDVRFDIDASRVPLLPGARRRQRAGHVTGAVDSNRDYVAELLEVESSVDTELVGLLLDPQTSGGLLISLPRQRRSAFEAAAGAIGATWALVGGVRNGPARLSVFSGSSD